MTRLTSTMRCDVRLQFRHGFYYAAAFVTVVLIIILNQIPEEVLPVFLPIFVMGNMTMNTFYFVAGLVLLEKDDGVLEGLVVTPLRRWEYLWSKLLTLALLTVLENSIIVTAVVGLSYNAALFIVGVLLLAFINTLYGFIIVARYDSINSFIFPSIFWTMALSLPLLHYFDIVSTPLIYLHPVMAPLTLLVGAFQPITLGEVGYGLLYSLVWIAILFKLAKGAFYRFIIMKQGVKA
jgi:fluoroquinolone transport system permease protein